MSQIPSPDFSRLQDPDAKPEDVLRYSVVDDEAGGTHRLSFVDNATGVGYAFLTVTDPHRSLIDRYMALADAMARFVNTGGAAHSVWHLAKQVAENLRAPAVPVGLRHAGTTAAGVFDHAFDVVGSYPPAIVRVVEGDENFIEYLTGVDLERHAMEQATPPLRLEEDD